MDPRAADLRRAHLHADHRRRGVEAVRGRDDRGHPADQGRAARACKTSLGVSNVSFGIGLPRARGPELRLPAPLRGGRARPRDGQPEPHHAVRRDRARPSASSPTTSSSTAARTRSSASSPTSSPRAREEEAEAADPTAGMEPEEALHWHILRRKRDGVEAQIDASVEKIGAVPTLNDVLLPAMKEVGDKFGAGELILPFVLQSAEVMKRAVAQLEQLPRQARGLHEGHRRARDRVRRRARHRQVARQHDPHQQRLHASSTSASRCRSGRSSTPPRSTTRPRSACRALLVSTSKQMPLCVQELHAQGLEYPLLIGGAAINRKFGLRALYPGGQGVRRRLRARRLLLQGRLRGPRRDGPARRARRARGARRAGPRGRAPAARDGRGGGRARHDATTPCARAARDRQPDPGAAVLGRARDRGRPRRGLRAPRHPRAVQAALGRARREGRGVARAGRRGLPPAPGAHVGRAGLPAPARAARLLPLLLRGQRDRRARPRGPRDRARAARLPAPAQGRPHLPRRLLPPEGAAASSTSSPCRR